MLLNKNASQSHDLAESMFGPCGMFFALPAVEHGNRRRWVANQ